MAAAVHVNPLTEFLAAAPAATGEVGRSSVDRILDAVRLHLGMEIAFASRYVGEGGRFTGRQFTHLSSDLPLPSSPGDIEPVEDGYCWHILEGRLPELIHDAQDIPFAAGIGITAALPVGCHISVPLRLKDGSVHGSFCCLSRAADHSLTERDLKTVRAFADLAAEQIESELARDRRIDAIRARIGGVIADELLAIVYQPIHALADGRPCGVESLARFPEVDGAYAPPNEWFAAAEEVGLGTELELLAIKQALAGIAYIPSGLYIAVNVSPQTALSGRLQPLLDAVPAARLVVEVTEHSEVADYAALHTALAPLRGRARIAIDDVGAGYSGLRHIVDMKPDLLKLDMGLTRDIDRDEARHALAQALVAFAGRIGAEIVAEGIETPEEAATLKALGVRYGQGWHFSRPMPAVAAQQFLLGAGKVAVAAPAPAPAIPRRAALR
jgi:EAL domain-containing protein (putative c-di-GMP-specific phosphodiesterase class I)